MVQLYETMMTRHTTMVVGPTGGGKSVVINTLCQSQTRFVIMLSLCIHTHKLLVSKRFKSSILLWFSKYVAVVRLNLKWAIVHFFACIWTCTVLFPSPIYLYGLWHCRLGLMTRLYSLNPKAMSVIELYGILDPATRDWTDGILSNIFRDINKPTDKKEKR